MRDDGSRKGRDGPGPKPPRPTGKPQAPARPDSSFSNPKAPTAPRTHSSFSNPRAQAPPPARPQRPPPDRTESSFANPRGLTPPAPRPPSSPQLPRTASSPQQPRAPGRAATLEAMEALEQERVQNAEQTRQRLVASAFATDDEITQFDAVLGPRGAAPPSSGEEEEEETTGAGFHFDGQTAAEGLSQRDLFKATHPPVQSRPGRRSSKIYRQVLDQFAVGTNPRYHPDPPDRSRAHIFVWDVTRAMGVEIPHFLGPRELTVAQTVDWLRHEGPMKGWRSCNELDAWRAANQGCPVVAVPKEIRVKLLAMVRPGVFNTDGKPFLSAAALVRGNGLGAMETFGVQDVEFFVTK